ncbi:MAG: pantoate--beta-alanine ligase [Desulfobacterales bacterium]|nr:pantoate--beta-alanine ligase [Desulfobacterales bacterium]
METITTASAMQAQAQTLRNQGKRIVLVPTMGFLHEGHLSLMRLGLAHADALVVSIFVNPTQFGPGEDLEAYPRDFDRDLALCRDEGAAVVFAPQPEEIYPAGFQTHVDLESLPKHLCGKSRPVHFRGVATVVTKLFNIVSPHMAVFGEKDFQQLTVIRRMVRDLNLPVGILGGPTFREADGLAMSSRNAYLTPAQRPAALSLIQSLHLAREMAANGETDARRIVEAATGMINAHPEARIDYVAVCNPQTLEDLTRLDGPARMFLAVRVGRARLIDNMAIN